MHDVFIAIKSIALIAIVWFTDVFVLELASVSIITPCVREFLIDFKEIISIVVSLLIATLTIYKIRNEHRNRK